MGLADVMSSMRLEWFAEVGLGVSCLGFAALVVSLLLRRNRAAFERARWLPLEAERPARGAGGPGARHE